jgi:hypothetical protein
MAAWLVLFWPGATWSFQCQESSLAVGAANSEKNSIACASSRGVWNITCFTGVSLVEPTIFYFLICPIGPIIIVLYMPYIGMGYPPMSYHYCPYMSYHYCLSHYLGYPYMPNKCPIIWYGISPMNPNDSNLVWDGSPGRQGIAWVHNCPLDGKDWEGTWRGFEFPSCPDYHH